MKRLLAIVTVHSFRELFKYKSFLFLVFGLAIFNKLVKTYVPIDRSDLKIPKIKEVSLVAAEYLFNDFATLFIKWIFDYRILLALFGLFFLKQVISIWPSSDMRRMHREERARGIIGSLLALKWQQLLWDAIALTTLISFLGASVIVAFQLTSLLWQNDPTLLPFFLFVGSILFASPLFLAGLSYSSKLAVISDGTFKEKLVLFYKLFSSFQVFLPSWLFYLARIIIEALFVAVLPFIIIVTIDNWFLRMLLATLVATPVYSWLKMASFKFFLEVYKPFTLVYQEYKDYYERPGKNST